MKRPDPQAAARRAELDRLRATYAERRQTQGRRAAETRWSGSEEEEGRPDGTISLVISVRLSAKTYEAFIRRAHEANIPVRAVMMDVLERNAPAE